MKNMKITLDLLKIINENQRFESCEFHNSVRDVLTDLYHIANRNGIDIDNLNAGARAVFEEEVAEALEEE